LELDLVHVGVPVGILAKLTIRIAAHQGPICGLPNGLPHALRFATQLTQNENSVKAGMHVPVGFLDISAAIGYLVVQNACNHRFRLGCRLANQAEIVRHMERGGNVIAQVSEFPDRPDPAREHNRRLPGAAADESEEIVHEIRRLGRREARLSHEAQCGSSHSAKPAAKPLAV
jgi:hypothetical protein